MIQYLDSTIQNPEPVGFYEEWTIPPVDTTDTIMSLQMISLPPQTIESREPSSSKSQASPQKPKQKAGAESIRDYFPIIIGGLVIIALIILLSFAVTSLFSELTWGKKSWNFLK